MGFTETSLSSEFDHFLLFKERTFWCLSALAGLTVCIPAINSGMGTNCNFFPLWKAAIYFHLVSISEGNV